MVTKASRASIGLADYLEYGYRRDSKYTRTQKDEVVPLYGNLKIFKKIEQYLFNQKNYKDNYLHITIAFSQEDIDMLDSLRDNHRFKLLKVIVLNYIKHHTSGYDLDNEVIAYAEIHKPIIKEENNKIRLEHIHIAIASYNPLSNTRLRTTFYKNCYMDDVLQTYINKQYKLTQPRDKQGKKIETKTSRIRAYYKELFKDIKSMDELLKYFDNNNIEYKEVKTENILYYQIINPKGKDINLRGEGFEHIQKIKIDKDFKYNNQKNTTILHNILQSYYKKREKEIDERRSKDTKERLNRISQKPIKEDSENSLQSSTPQQKIFYKHYKHLMGNQLKEYSIYSDKEKKKSEFINKKESITIVDIGDKIVFNSNDIDDLKESVTLMLNIAKAKNWRVVNLIIKGAKEFKEEVERQIANIIREKKQESHSLKLKELLKKEIDTRPLTATQTYKKQFEDKLYKKEQKIKEAMTIPFKLSICRDRDAKTDEDTLTKWEQVEIDSYIDLENYMKMYPYSQSIFDDGQRSRDSANSFNNLLIYHIENREDTPQLTIEDVEEILKKYNISAMLLLENSSNIKINKNIAQRYKIVIPTKQEIDIKDNFTYSVFQQLITQALKIKKYINMKEIKDRGRFYYKSRINAEPIIIKGNMGLNIEQFQKRAKEHVAEVRKNEQKKREIIANIDRYKILLKEESDNLIYFNVEKIMGLDIQIVIKYYEPTAKYIIIDNSTAYNLKNDKTYNTLTYLHEKIGTTNIDIVAEELETILGESFIKVNYTKVKNGIKKAKQSATDEQSFEILLKKFLNVEYLKLDNNSLYIEHHKIALVDIEESQQEIIKKLDSNKKEEQQPKKSRNRIRM